MCSLKNLTIFKAPEEGGFLVGASCVPYLDRKARHPRIRQEAGSRKSVPRLLCRRHLLGLRLCTRALKLLPEVDDVALRRASIDVTSEIVTRSITTTFGNCGNYQSFFFAIGCAKRPGRTTKTNSFFSFLDKQARQAHECRRPVLNSGLNWLCA